MLPNIRLTLPQTKHCIKLVLEDYSTIPCTQKLEVAANNLQQLDFLQLESVNFLDGIVDLTPARVVLA